MKVSFTNGYPIDPARKIHEVVEMEHPPRVGDRVSFDRGDDDHTIVSLTWNLKPGEGDSDMWVTLR